MELLIKVNNVMIIIILKMMDVTIVGLKLVLHVQLMYVLIYVETVLLI